MIVKKKGLYLGLLLSILGIGNAMQAKRVQIRNSTPFNIRFEIDYNTAGCRTDDQMLPPGQIMDINMGGCLINSVKAQVFQKKHAGTALEATGAVGILGEQVIDANPYTSLVGGRDLIFIVNGPYHSSAPEYKKQGGIFYQVDRSSTKFKKFPTYGKFVRP